jgi:hypothetical protein
MAAHPGHFQTINANPRQQRNTRSRHNFTLFSIPVMYGLHTSLSMIEI